MGGLSVSGGSSRASAWRHTKIFDLDRTALLQRKAVDRSLFVIGYRLAIFLFRDAQAVDGEVGLLRYALIEVAGAALEVDARLGWEVGDPFAWNVIPSALTAMLVPPRCQTHLWASPGE